MQARLRRGVARVIEELERVEANVVDVPPGREEAQVEDVAARQHGRPKVLADPRVAQRLGATWVTVLLRRLRRLRRRWLGHPQHDELAEVEELVAGGLAHDHSVRR